MSQEEMDEDEPIKIVPYDPSWPLRFEAERAALEDALREWVVGRIHHVGSTAIPGTDAKPTIDILVGVRDLQTSRLSFERLAALEYQYAPYLADEMHWFCKPNRLHRTHHLHLVPVNSPRYQEELSFRDYLRAHPDVAAEYASLKRELATRFEHDREGYTAAKTEFIRAALDRPLADLGLDG